MPRGNLGRFCLEICVKRPRKRFLAMIPTAVAAAGFLLIVSDSLPVGSVEHPVTQPAMSISPALPVVAEPATETPSPAPTSQPVQSPQPTPHATVAVAKTGNIVTIPSIGLSAQIVNVGLTADNAIDVPAGRQVGYWTGSAVPGTPGATFLDGHVDGILAHLQRISVGQTFSVRFNGQTFNYQVAHTETVALAGIDMNRALSTYGGASEGLNMMTCAGTYVPAIGTYDQRFVVYAVRIS